MAGARHFRLLARLGLGLLAASTAAAHRDREGDGPGQLSLRVILDVAGQAAGSGVHHGGEEDGGGSSVDKCTSRLTSWKAMGEARRAERGAFACYDVDGGGDLSQQEQALLVSDLNSLGLPGKDIVREADASGDGKLQLGEFQAILLDLSQRCRSPLDSWPSYQQARLYPGASFACYDKAGDVLLAVGRGGGDGRIDGFELVLLISHLSALGLPAVPYLRRADTDGDNELSFPEFKKLLDVSIGCAGLTSKEAIHEAAVLPGIAMACYDASHDGTVDGAELDLLALDLTTLGFGRDPGSDATLLDGPRSLPGRQFAARVDANGDGRLDFAEFSALAQACDSS